MSVSHGPFLETFLLSNFPYFGKATGPLHWDSYKVQSSYFYFILTFLNKLFFCQRVICLPLADLSLMRLTSYRQ